ncbi:MAG TPA: GNAT family N-acetyltransferase [Polyangia bacterium]|nr:GNAT family N-acetyltransferase [Polyangia bacterium]
MPIIADEIRRLAEEPETIFGDPAAPARVIRTPSYVLGLSPTPTQAAVSAVRTSADALDGVIAEVRGHLRAAGYTRCVWAVSRSSRPEGLAAALAARGFSPAHEAPYEPEMTAMIVEAPPPPAPPGIEARRVRDYDEYLASMRIAVTMMGASEADGGGWLAAAPALWADGSGIAQCTHVAFLDGKMVGFGWAVPTPAGLMLAGSSVLPGARGRGAYRALVAARWATAVSLGTPALAIQAGAMSRPVLERCGFQEVCRISVLQDPEVR